MPYRITRRAKGLIRRLATEARQSGDLVPVNVYHFRRTFKPQEIIPDIDFLRLC
ncbi:MAG: hypothetical protein KBA18_10960 [Kiritimatiellae bacterium]|nr:hypothetical protein [Kiritimatiellia bacterium]